MDGIDRFAEHVVRTESTAIPPAARAATRRFLLDALGIAVAGSAGPFVAELPAIGRVWRITEVAHKPFPRGRATHGVVDACLTLMRESPSSRPWPGSTP
jgi:2-methylcitrate dehydratase PrpD